MEKVQELIDQADEALANSPSYKNDPNLWEAVQALIQAVAEIRKLLKDPTPEQRNAS